MCITPTSGMVAGLIQPTLLGNGQVRVDMGPPTLAAADVPTTLEPTRPDGSVVAQVRLVLVGFRSAMNQGCREFRVKMNLQIRAAVVA